MNKMILIGYVGGEPEIKQSKNLETICSFRVATNERTNLENEHTEWFTIVTFGKTALYCSKRITRGVRVYIEGKLRSETYVDSAGINKFIIKVFPSELSILDHAKVPEVEPLTLTLENQSDTTALPVLGEF